MSTQITLPSAGGGTPLEGERYTYVYGNKSGNLNGSDIINAVESLDPNDTILVAPGDYFLGGVQIDLGNKPLRLKTWGTTPVADQESSATYGPVNLYAFNQEDYVVNKNVTCTLPGTIADVTFPSNYTEVYTQDIIQLLDGSRVYLGMYSDNIGNTYSIIKVNTNNTITNILGFDYSQNMLCYYNNGGTEYLAFYVNSNVVRIANANTGATLFNIVTNSYVTLMSNSPRGGDPSVYIHGTFSVAGGVACQGLAKFNITTGVVNSAFSLAVGTSASSITRIEVLPDTNLILTGYFSTFNGVSTPNFIYAINANGTTTGISATRNTNFGLGSPNNITAYFINNFIVIASDPSSILTFNGFDYITNVISLDSNGNFVNVSLTYDYRFQSLFPIYGSEKLGVVIYNNPTYLFFGSITPGNVLITDCAGVYDYNYFYNATLPYAFTTSVLKNIKNSNVLYLQYSVTPENDPPIFKFPEGYYSSEIDGFILNSIVFTGPIYRTSYITNCILKGIYFSEGATTTTVKAFLNNCVIKQVNGLIKNIKNCNINELRFDNPLGYHPANVTIVGSNIGDFYQQENTSLEGFFIIEDSNIGYAVDYLGPCSPQFEIKNCVFKTFLGDQNSFSNNIRIKITDSIIGQGLALKGTGSSINFDIILQNVLFNNGPGFNCNFNFNDVYGLIDFTNVRSYQGFAVIQMGQLNTNFSLIEYTNCIAPAYSFSVYYSSTTTGLDIKHNSCIADTDSFNVFYGASTTNYGSASYYNCRAKGQSFNNVDLFTNSAKLTRGVYKDCVVTDPDPANINFQVIPAGLKDYMMSCSMNNTNAIFLNPATSGGSGRIVDCVKLSPTGVVTKYNY